MDEKDINKEYEKLRNIEQDHYVRAYDTYFDSYKISGDSLETHIQLFLKGIFIINAGTLVLIPTFISIFNITTINLKELKYSIILLIFSLFATILTHAFIFFYYRTMQALIETDLEKKRCEISIDTFDSAKLLKYDLTKQKTNLKKLTPKYENEESNLRNILIALVVFTVIFTGSSGYGVYSITEVFNSALVKEQETSDGKEIKKPIPVIINKKAKKTN